jgi:hypothetical protein
MIIPLAMAGSARPTYVATPTEVGVEISPARTADGWIPAGVYPRAARSADPWVGMTTRRERMIELDRMMLEVSD